MLFPPHLSPEDRYKHLLYIGSVAAAEPLETFATWTVAGLAAIVALLLSHLDTLRHAMYACALRWGIISLVVAMVFGALTKQFGIVIRTGIAVINSLYAALHSPDGVAMLSAMKADSEKLPAELVKPFLWPFRCFLERNARKGMVDPLHGEKRFIKFLCIQIYFSYGMYLFAAIGLIILCCGIHEWT